MLTNCTIWVEGITDRRYVAHWLDLYQQYIQTESSSRAKFFKEDLHYSFVEYSGGNITHWSFLDEEGPDVERLCGKLFLIADNDGADQESAKGARHSKLKAKLGERFYLLPVREIENLLTPTIVGEILKAYGEFEGNLILVDLEYADQPLGGFIESSIIKDISLKVRRGSYSADSGTISDKVKFCERAIASMSSFEDLSEQAKAITIKVHDFIRSAQH